MNPLSALLVWGLYEGYWSLKKSIPALKASHAEAMEKRFGADQRKCEEWQSHCEQVEVLDENAALSSQIKIRRFEQ